MSWISVIVPIYNVEPYLCRCIDSILAQSFYDFKLILIDDGSPDRCGEICDEYARKDSRIEVIHQPNGGLSAARNAGINKALLNEACKWITFIDSDDWVHRQYLELLFKAVNKYETSISQCLLYKTSDQTNLPSVYGEIKEVSPAIQYLNYYSANACGKLFNISCFDKIRFPEGKLYEDVAIWYKILFKEKTISVVNEPLYYYFYRDDSIMNSNWTPAQLDQVSAWEEQISFLKSYNNEDVFHAGVQRFLWVLSNQLKSVAVSQAITEAERRKYSRLIRNKIGRLLKDNRIFLKDTKSYHWYYEQAHPRISWCYWTAKGLSGKLRGRNNE